MTPEKFWSKVDKENVAAHPFCWAWLGTRSGGYGLVREYVVSEGKRRRVSTCAHRRAYELAVEPVPDGLQIDHLCRNRGCVNPAHLEPVTLQENVRRGESFSAQNTRKKTCPRGHAYVQRVGRRDCRTCQREACRRYRSRLGRAA